MADKPIMNIDEVEYSDRGKGGRFEAKLGMISPHLGAQKLGYNAVVLAPGKTAWPYHFHHRNEEMFFILEGAGVLRYADEESALRPGDIVCCPPGSGSRHQITAAADEELKYLALSTVEEPEVAEYPDSNKVGVLCGPDPDAGPDEPPLRVFFPRDGRVDYWEGED